MAALGLLFGLLLVVILLAMIMFAALAALQGLNLASEADPLLAFFSVVLIFPCVVYGLVFWLTGKNIPQKLMDDLREKQRKDEEKCRKKPGENGHGQDGHAEHGHGQDGHAEHGPHEHSDDHHPGNHHAEDHHPDDHRSANHHHIDVSVRNADGKALIDDQPAEKK
jgi:hypothetical protein